MNWYKIAQSIPLTRDEVEKHLLSRGFNPQQYNWDYDEESGTVYIRLYSPDGKILGMYEYRPHVSTKGGNDVDHSKRYFADIPSEGNKRSGIWGIENIDPNKPYLFIAEGIFDAAPINAIGEPAIAILTVNVPGEKIQQLKYLAKHFIAILDNDAAGQSGRIRGRNSGRIKHGDLKAVVEDLLGGESHVTPDPYNDFGEMYEKDPQSAAQFIQGILRGLS